jgi:hypothetical protein
MEIDNNYYEVFISYFENMKQLLNFVVQQKLLI